MYHYSPVKLNVKIIVLFWIFWWSRKTGHIPANTSTLKQRWSSTFINVVSTLIFGWTWKLSRRTFIDVVSTLTKQRWYNYVDSTSMNQRCLNVEIWLKMKVEPTYVYRRCFNVDKTTLIELRWFNVNDPMLFQRWY